MSEDEWWEREEEGPNAECDPPNEALGRVVGGWSNMNESPGDMGSRDIWASKPVGEPDMSGMRLRVGKSGESMARVRTGRVGMDR